MADPLKLHIEEAGADSKRIQHGPLGVTYYLLQASNIFHPTVVESITTYATVPGHCQFKLMNNFFFCIKIK
jgi:hypothetical protein